MAANIGDIRVKVVPRIQDDASRLTATPGGDIDTAILSAVAEYQREHPLEKAVRIQGAATFKYAIAGLTGFVDGFSEVRGVAYPHTGTEQQLPWLEQDEFELVRNHDGLFLWFPNISPTATEFFLALFTVPHTATMGTWTAPATHDEAIADLAAAHCCDQLAAVYGQDTQSTIGADVVDRQSKPAQYRALAKTFREAYKAKTQSSGKAAATVVVGATNRGFRNQSHSDYHFHGRGTA